MGPKAPVPARQRQKGQRRPFACSVTVHPRFVGSLRHSRRSGVFAIEIAMVHPCRKILAMQFAAKLCTYSVYTVRWNSRTMSYKSVRLWAGMPRGFFYKVTVSFILYSWQPPPPFLVKVNRVIFNVLQVSCKFLFHKRHLSEWRLELTKGQGQNFFPNYRFEGKKRQKTKATPEV